MGQLALSGIWEVVLVEKATPWGVPAADVTLLTTLRAAASAAFAKVQDKTMRTHMDVVVCQEAFKALIGHMRYLKANFFNCPPRTEEEMESLGLSTRKPPVPVPAPTTCPEIDIDTSMLRQLSVRYRDAGSTTWGKPAGVRGADIRWAISDTPVTETAKLTHAAFDTATPHTIHFTGDDRGKTVYISARWQNTTDGVGPFGEIVAAIIP
jgi:hypothetical protein